MTTTQTMARRQPEAADQPAISAIRIALFPARAFLALGWIRAGVEKLISAEWWMGEELRTFVAEHDNTALPLVYPAAESITPAIAVLLAVLVLVAEFAIGFGLLTARRLRAALVVACALNVVFVAFGAVTPSAFYLVLQMTLLFGIARKPGGISRRFATVGISSGLVTAAIMTPMISTLHPAEVIEDPALMIATLALLASATLGVEVFGTGRVHKAGPTSKLVLTDEAP